MLELDDKSKSIFKTISDWRNLFWLPPGLDGRKVWKTHYWAITLSGCLNYWYVDKSFTRLDDLSSQTAVRSVVPNFWSVVYKIDYGNLCDNTRRMQSR